jgi:tetratricopeptide (TPR) repeat protein
MNKMRHLSIVVILPLFFILSCGNQTNQESTADAPSTAPEVNTKKKRVVAPRFPSPAALLEQTVGNSKIIINYSRPSVVSPLGVDRTGRVWGILVPYDFNARPSSARGNAVPWRAGANENTVINFSHDALVEGQAIKAGKYGLFMAIHEKGGATLILSNNSSSWGSFSYKESEDALRVEIKSEEISATNRLTYTIQEIGKSTAMVLLDWEKKRLAFEVSFDTHGMIVEDYRNYLSDTTGLTWKDYNTAAKYCGDNKVNLDEGLSWIDHAITMKESYATLMTKAQILLAMNKGEESQTVLQKALSLASTTPGNFYSYGTQLLQQGNTDQAMIVYEQLYTKWPEEWLSAHGLGRVYSAQGNYDKAIEYEKIALTKAPEVNKGYIEWAIGKLEKGINFN